MVDVLETYHKWFATIGTASVDSNTNKITVNGSCDLRFMPLPNSQGERSLPVHFDHVAGDFSVEAKGLTTLEGCPRTVGGQFFASYNRIKDLIGGPDHVGKRYVVRYCEQLESLDGLATHIGQHFAVIYKKDLPLLRSLVSPRIELDRPQYETWESVHQRRQVEQILRSYAGQGQSGALACAAELADAGFKGNARW